MIAVTGASGYLGRLLCAELEQRGATLRRLSKMLLLLLSLIVATYCLIAVRTAQASQPFSGNLTGAQETPPTGSAGTGFGTVVLSDDQTMMTVNLSFSGLGSNATAAHIHTAPVGVPASSPFHSLVYQPPPVEPFRNRLSQSARRR